MTRTILLLILLWIVGPLAQYLLYSLTTYHQWAAGFGQADKGWHLHWGVIFFALFVAICLLQLVSLWNGLLGPAFRREFHRRNGLCMHCGYNLTGNLSGTCPECGKPC